jgi:hypothetical protein
MRRMNCERELKNIRQETSRKLGIETDFVPFLVESSMMYSYAEKVAGGTGIPKYDTELGTLSKVPVNEQFSSALEYFLGYSYRIKVYIFGKSKSKGTDILFEDNADFTKWVRVNIAIWASLISGIIFLWLIALRIPLLFAFFGGTLHAISAAGIARYTGQDIVRGNFALPFITGAIFLLYAYYRKPSKFRLFMLGFCVFTAMSSWDMTQIVFSLWGIVEIFRITLRQAAKVESKIYLTKGAISWICIGVAFIISALIIPYNRAHMLIVSPFLIIILPIIIVLHFIREKPIKNRIIISILSLIFTFIMWKGIALIGGFTGNYSHFASLLYAKIKFLNIKPLNPDLLNFDARSVWVPAMHSANRRIYISFFPISMFFTGVLLLISLYTKQIKNSIKHYLPILYFPVCMFVIYSVSFFFIVRYHVFAIIFISLLLPILFFIWYRNIKIFSLKELLKIIFTFVIIFIIYNILLQLSAKSSFSVGIFLTALKTPLITVVLLSLISLITSLSIKCFKSKAKFADIISKSLIVVMCIFILITELDGSLYSQRKYEQHFFPETAGLIKWLRPLVSKKTFMADFNLSPLLKNYCHATIVMQPKFELGETRELYREYMTILFHGSERELSLFCLKNNAKYFIYDRGYANSEGIYSPMYMAGAHRIKEGTPVYEMNLKQDRDLLRYFYEIKPPSKLNYITNRYILFKVITPKDILKSEDYVKESEREIKKKNYKQAVIYLEKAIFRDPKNAKAYLRYMKIFNKAPDITIQ